MATKQYAAYFNADTTTSGGGRRVVRCTGTSPYKDKAEDARKLGEQDGRPFVVADQHGAVEP